MGNDVESFDRELRRGTLELLLLNALADRPGHGYELIQRLRDASGDRFQVREGTLYPILYRLEDGGWIVPEWQQPEGGGRGVPRKVYQLSDAGRVRLEELVAYWRGFTSAVDAVLGSQERSS
jgi:PadR family transcriptional regulator